MCDCISLVNKKLREETEDPQAELVTAITIIGNKLEGFPALTAQVRTKRRDGTLSEKSKTISLRPTFCPFCGKEYT